MLIKEANKEKIEAIIKATEGRATARTVTFRGMIKSLEILEESLGICKKDMVGITANIDTNAQDFPNAYKYTPMSTHFTVIRKASGWDLVSVSRDTTRRRKHRFHVTLTDEAKKAIIETKTAF